MYQYVSLFASNGYYVLFVVWGRRRRNSLKISVRVEKFDRAGQLKKGLLSSEVPSPATEGVAGSSIFRSIVKEASSNTPTSAPKPAIKRYESENISTLPWPVLAVYRGRGLAISCVLCLGWSTFLPSLLSLPIFLWAVISMCAFAIPQNSLKWAAWPHFLLLVYAMIVLLVEYVFTLPSIDKFKIDNLVEGFFDRVCDISGLYYFTAPYVGARYDLFVYLL